MTVRSSVTVGDERELEFPPLTRTMFVRYAGASGDFNPMHHDDTIATRPSSSPIAGVRRRQRSRNR